jgi:NAD(P)-dependent dehydrogenase (short-subunit alcohol dehydrogenase family)
MSQTPPVTLVTGVSRGIGAGIADYLTARGHHIIGLARQEPKAFQGTFYAVDLADADATQSILAEAVAKHRPLRVVNNAGLARHSPVVEAKLEDFDAMMAINLRAALQVMQAVIPAMRDARFGRIVNIGSRASLGKEGRTIYGATKAGLMGMTRTVALETIRDGITVNLIGPGPIETDMIRQSYPEGSDARAKFLREIPMERFGQPKEIAAAAAYFLSDDAGFTTGQALYVCGGLTAGLAPL